MTEFFAEQAVVCPHGPAVQALRTHGCFKRSEPKPWRPWRPRGRRSDAQLMASVHTRWWWVPAIARRYAEEADRG